MILSAAMQCSKILPPRTRLRLRSLEWSNSHDAEWFRYRVSTDSGIFNIMNIWNRFHHLIWWIFFRIWVYNLITFIFFTSQLHGPKYLEIPGSSTMVSKRVFNMNGWWNSYHIHPSCRFPVYVLASCQFFFRSDILDVGDPNRSNCNSRVQYLSTSIPWMKQKQPEIRPNSTRCLPWNGRPQGPQGPQASTRNGRGPAVVLIPALWSSHHHAWDHHIQSIRSCVYVQIYIYIYT